MMRNSSLLIWLALVFSSVGHGHPNHDLDSVRLNLYIWSNALVRDDPATFEQYLTQDSPLRETWLPRLRESGEVDDVDIRHATFTPNDAGILAAPVVFRSEVGATAHVAQMVSEDGVWKVATLVPTALPAGLVPRLPEQSPTRPVRFSLKDAETGNPVYGRVNITAGQSEYWPPRGHQKNIAIGWRDDVGGDVFIDGATYAYVRPEFVVDLPIDDFTITVLKGTEYLPATAKLTLTEDPPEPVTIALERWTNMNARGWYSGDTHVHFLDDHTAHLEIQAEDLNVINVLATKWGELITNVEHVTGAPSTRSFRNGLIYFNEETRHGFLGHTILQRIKTLVYPLTWGGPRTGVQGQPDYPPMAHQADKAHAQGALVTWAHFPYPDAEVSIDVALDKIDTVDLFTWGDAFKDDDLGRGPAALTYWYHFLNTGFRLPATAGTDKMLNTQVVGSVKTYAFVGKPEITYNDWIEAIGSGRTFVTTGPVVEFSANGQPIGSDLELRKGDPVKLRAEVSAPYDLYPVDRLEIVVGGRVVSSRVNDAGLASLSVTADITAESSTWAAARAHGDTLLPYQVWAFLRQPGVPPMAHTSPVYLTVSKQPVWSDESAGFLASRVDAAIEWARTQANFETAEQKDEVIALFERAKRVYTKK